MDDVNVFELAKKFPYVCPFSWQIETRWGRIDVPRGFLSDGDSGVPDICPEAFFAHDRLYALPEIVVYKADGDTVRRLPRIMCDLIYGGILVDYHQIHALWRVPALWLMGGRAWRKHRTREMQAPDYLTTLIFPNPENWVFPSFRTIEAFPIAAVWPSATFSRP